MQQFLKTIKEKIFPHKIVKVFMGGLDAAGKTTILQMLKKREAKNMGPTMGFNVQQIKLNRHLTIEVWDVGGGWNLRKSCNHYYDNCQVVIWVVDCTDFQRIDKIKQQFEQTMLIEKLHNPVVLILASKQDLAEQTKEFMQPQFLIEKLNLNRLPDKKTSWNVTKCSGLTGYGLKEAISWLANTLQQKK